jgi:glutamate racemase
MKIGIFDSGLGGLLVLKRIAQELPEYDYIYLGDTARVPYGDKSPEAIYLFTEQAVDWLFNQGCELIIVACNTASAQALRKIQQCFLPGQYDDRRVLGVIIPTVEMIAKAPHPRIGVLATSATVKSQVYELELKKLLPDAQVFQQAAPMLVPLIEQGELAEAEREALNYIKPLLEQDIQTLILGCTHYELLAPKLRQDLPKLPQHDRLDRRDLQPHIPAHRQPQRELRDLP